MPTLQPVRQMDLSLHGRAASVSRSLLQEAIIADAQVANDAAIQQSKIAGLVAALAALGTSITNEQTRAEGAEAVLDDRLDTLEGSDSVVGSVAYAVKVEQTRALAAEQALSVEISEEVSRALAAEEVLDGKITTEKNRAEAAELVLTNGLAQEISDRIAAVSAEEVARIAGDNVLDGKITTEKNRAEAAELVLTNGLAQEISDRTAAVSAEQAARIAGDAATLASAQGYTNTAITNLINGAPEALDTLKEIADQLANDESVVNALINTVAANLVEAKAYTDTEVLAEETRALAAEAVIQGEVDAEEIRALAAEGVLQGNIDAEESRAMAAEGVLQGNIDAEEVRALAAEGVLQGNIDSEEVRAMAAEGVLQDNIDTVAANLAQEILDRQADVNAEETRAMAEELDIRNDFAAADLVLDGKITAEETRAMAEEADIRLDFAAADALLQTAVDNESLRAQNEEADIRVDFAAADAVVLSTSQSYTDQKIADLVDNAPALLDTLNELAAALGDDPNFSTTVLNAISTEQTRAEAAEAALDSRLDSLENKSFYESFIDNSVGGETELLKPVGAPVIPDSAATEFYIDGRKMRRGVHFEVSQDGSKVTFAALDDGVMVELRYFA